MSEAFEPLNPFPGLRPFEMQESHLFFGREGLSNELLEKLKRTRFTTVVGGSGSGKSSLVRAGLLPALYAGFMASAGSNWRVAILRPGAQPVHSLAEALDRAAQAVSEGIAPPEIEASPTEALLNRSTLGLVNYARQTIERTGENLLVVVDQFEELFRLLANSERNNYRDQADTFVGLLLEAGRQSDVPIYIVLTMRSDFLGDCDAFRGLPEAVNEGQYLIPRMIRDEYREAIVGPVSMYGATIAPRLINRLLNDVGDRSELLPIFQHALMRTWDRWKQEGQASGPIDLEHYQAIGSMAEALSMQADEAYHELPDERSREIAEKIFKRLTGTGQDNRALRNPTTFKELCDVAGASQSEVLSVIETFRGHGRAFLTPPADNPLNEYSIIDIAHESIIRNWQRLRQWVEEEKESRRTYLRLNEDAELYSKGMTALMRDPALRFALDWRERVRPTEEWARRYAPDFDRAMNYLMESNEANERERYAAEKRQRRETTRWRLISLGLVLVFLMSLTLTMYAFNQQREASRQRMIAEEQTLEAVRQTEIAERKTKEALAAQEALKQLSEDTRMQLEAERARRASKR